MARTKSNSNASEESSANLSIKADFGPEHAFNRTQSQTFANLLGTLLPKQISGELSISQPTT